MGSNEITPLYYSLYSTKSPNFISENEEIKKAMNMVGSAAENKGIWVIDRGADGDYLYKSLLANNRDFIIRLVGTRDLVHDGKTARSLWLALMSKTLDQ